MWLQDFGVTDQVITHTASFRPGIMLIWSSFPPWRHSSFAIQKWQTQWRTCVCMCVCQLISLPVRSSETFSPLECSVSDGGEGGRTRKITVVLSCLSFSEMRGVCVGGLRIESKSGSCQSHTSRFFPTYRHTQNKIQCTVKWTNFKMWCRFL